MNLETSYTRYYLNYFNKTNFIINLKEYEK